MGVYGYVLEAEDGYTYKRAGWNYSTLARGIKKGGSKQDSYTGNLQTPFPWALNGNQSDKTSEQNHIR